MQDLESIEIKAFVPAKDFELSKRFYKELGFTMKSESDELAYFCHHNCSFLLKNFYIKEHTDNFMMHLLVKDVEAWWERIKNKGIVEKYNVLAGPPEIRPWKMKDFYLADPSGVLWRFGENI